MEAELQKKLIDEVKDISNIVLLSQETLKLLEVIIRNEEDTTKNNVKQQNIFLQFSARIYWRTIVLEMVKLLHDKDNEKFNIFRFIRKLKVGGEFEDAKISETHIVRWETMLESYKNVISDLKTQRDKMYAHQDKDYKNVTNTTNLKQVNELLSTIRDVLQQIYYDVLESNYLLQSPIGGPKLHLEAIINLLTQERKTNISNMENF